MSWLRQTVKNWTRKLWKWDIRIPEAKHIDSRLRVAPHVNIDDGYKWLRQTDYKQVCLKFLVRVILSVWVIS